ncbi:MAG: hypothetical protein K2X64_04985, partial [Rhodocyclaceae bacterium]|nr:hypothetical protein [Rhodocyclaceae bacterium]
MPVRPSTLKALTLTGALLLLAIPADARRSHHWGDDNSRWGEPRNKQKVRWRNYSSGPSSITSDWMQGRTSGSQRETKGLTTWEAAPKDEQQVDEEIEQAQIDYGTEDKRVARLMWKHAKNYFQARNYKKTKELIGEIRALTERDPNVTQHLPMDEIAKTERLANQGMLPLECRHDRQNYGGGVFGYDNLGSTGQSAPPTASAPASKAGKTANTPKKPGQSKAVSLLASWPSALNNMPVPQQRHSNTSSSSALKLNQKVHQPIPIASLNQPYPGFNQSYSTGSPWTNNIA